MSWPDLVNSGFEFFAGVFLILNIRRIIRDKSVKGVSVWPVAYFSLFGIWNMYYYPFLEQWASFCCGLLVVLVNTVWVGLAIYYSRKKKAGLTDAVEILHKCYCNTPAKCKALEEERKATEREVAEYDKTGVDPYE